MLRDALAFLLPVPCAGCGAPGRALCRACAPALAPAVAVVARPGIGAVAAGLDYDGVARASLLAFKEHGATGLARPLAVPFAAAVAAALRRAPDALPVAVPTSRAARRRRGYAPVALLARAAGIRLAPAFAPARPHAAQKGLDLAGRAANLAGAFELDRTVAGRRMLLLDDVVTTGATLAAAAETLRAGGADVAGAAVLAATARRHGSLR